MVRETKSTILIAIIGAMSAVVIAVITTYGTIAVSAPEAQKVKQELEDISDLQKIANLPIGTIVPSMLYPSQFAEVVGDPSVFDPEKSKLVLADGQEDITRSRYGKLLGNTRHTPDLRGMFLRGVNAGRHDGKEDPNDRRESGDYQGDALQQHGHRTDACMIVWDKKGDVGYRSNNENSARLAGVYEVTGPNTNAQDETRPKNVAVYFYIKIN